MSSSGPSRRLDCRPPLVGCRGGLASRQRRDKEGLRHGRNSSSERARTMAQAQRENAGLEQGEDGDQSEEGQVMAFHRIEELENYGVNKVDITKLKTGGYNTIESVAHATLRKLVDVKGLSEQKCQKIKDTIKSNQLVQIDISDR